MKIGVLALQGAVQEHERALRRLGADVVQVRLPKDLEGISGLVLPGGESTVMARFLQRYGLVEAIRDKASAGMAFFGVCAGAIILCQDVDGRPGALGLLPARATRNAYGRQLSSFEETIETPVGPVRGIFIRAPLLEPLGDTEVLSRRLSDRGGEAVLLRHDRVLGASFHPELSGDDRLHEYFLGMVA